VLVEERDGCVAVAREVEGSDRAGALLAFAWAFVGVKAVTHFVFAWLSGAPSRAPLAVAGRACVAALGASVRDRLDLGFAA
jgi:hypothetical protein